MVMWSVGPPKIRSPQQHQGLVHGQDTGVVLAKLGGAENSMPSTKRSRWPDRASGQCDAGLRATRILVHHCTLGQPAGWCLPLL